jgi:hypothetical protein
MNPQARALINKHCIHAVDKVAPYHQKRVTAVCGARVMRQKAIYNPRLNDITCTGCAALLMERNKEGFA